jgi:hypothetical protein
MPSPGYMTAATDGFRPENAGIAPLEPIGPNAAGPGATTIAFYGCSRLQIAPHVQRRIRSAQEPFGPPE